MDHDTSLLTRLKEEARLRQQHAAASRTANQAMTPQIKMIVSDWYTDELGNQGVNLARRGGGAIPAALRRDSGLHDVFVDRDAVRFLQIDLTTAGTTALEGVIAVKRDGAALGCRTLARHQRSNSERCYCT